MSEQKKTINGWLLAGVLLSLFTLVAAVYGINSSPVLLLDTAAVTEAAQQTMECVRSGDLDSLSQMLLGNPALGESPKKQDAAGQIWYAYLDSIQYEVSEECRPTDSGLEVDVIIHCLDISKVTEEMQAVVPTLMTQAQAEQASEAEISKVLCTAIGQILDEAAPMTEQVIVLQLVRIGNRWQVVPTEAFQQFLSGFVTA